MYVCVHVCVSRGDLPVVMDVGGSRRDSRGGAEIPDHSCDRASGSIEVTDNL